jgi:hypothetical protein
MKRYRVLDLGFDSRAWILREVIHEDWDEHVKESWRENQRRIEEGVIAEYGAFENEAKLKNFTDFGPVRYLDPTSIQRGTPHASSWRI